MNSNTYNLRSKKIVARKESSSSNDEIEFFETTNINMAEINNILAQMEALQQEVNTLRQHHGNTNDASRLNLQKVHVPKFNKHNPQLWFAQIERSFALCDVSSDIDRFDFVSVRLEDDVLLAVEDLITNPPASEKFVTLKQRLISKFAESSESKLRRLLQGGETVGLKPSEILAHMKRLAPGTGNEAIIRTLFLGQMPESIRPLLTIWEDDDLDKLAKMADKMIEVNNNNSMVSAVSRSTTRSDKQLHPDNLTSMSDLIQSIKALSDKIDQINFNNNNYRRDRSRSRGSRNRSQNKQNPVESQMCWYHQKFGDDAKRCKPTCPRYNNKSEN